MYYQTFHGKPLLIGHVSRLPQEAFTFLDSVPFLAPFKSIYTWNVVEESWVDFEYADVSRQLAPLAAENVRYIVLNKPLIAEGLIERWRDWVTFEPAYEDDQVLVYKTAPRAGADFLIDQEMAAGIGLIRAAVTPQQAIQGGVIKADIRWASSAPPVGDYQVCFYLRGAQTAADAAVCMPISSGWPTSEWGANAVARGLYVLPIPEELTAGEFTLDMALAAVGEQEAAGEIVPIAEMEVIPFSPQQPVSLCWEGDLCLRGYDLTQASEQVPLTLYWQAAAPTTESYKRFVHLIDPSDGRVVAQSDAVPRGWTYPTDIWEPGEIVADRLSLPLDGVAPGEYDLRIGWYAVDGGKPLTACPAGDCAEQTADYLYLAPLTLP